MIFQNSDINYNNDTYAAGLEAKFNYGFVTVKGKFEFGYSEAENASSDNIFVEVIIYIFLILIESLLIITRCILISSLTNIQ